MAELVGLVSAIAALVSTGYRIAKTISDCVDDLGTAADQMMLIATDTKAMTRIFQELKIRLKNSKKVTAQVLSLAEEIVELGQKTLRNVEECLLPLMPQIGKSSDPLRKARWLFAKSKITSRRASLDSLKLTMTLLLHAVDRAWGDADEADTKEEIEKLLVSAKDTKMNFIKAEIFDQAVEHQYEPNDEDKDLIATPSDDDNNEEKRLKRPGSFDSATRNSESYDISLTQRSMTSGNGFDYSNVDLSKWTQKHGPKTRNPLKIMPMPSDDQFIEIADHLKVQMAVTRYALVIISDPSPHSQDRSKPTSSISDGFYKASSKGSAENQSIVQSESSVSDGEMESITDASETMGDRHGSSWKYTLPNREPVPPFEPSPRGYENKPANPFVHDARQSETFPGGAYYERPPMTPQYGHEQYPHINAKTYPQSQRFPGDYLQQNASFPYYYDNHWSRNVPSPPNSTRQPYRAPPPADNPEKIALEKQLAEIKAAEEKREAEAKLKVMETRIREETERAYRQKMEERDRQDALLARERADAAEKAKMEIEEVRQAAEKETRILIEKEREAAEERKKEEAAAIARAQQAARDQIDAERRAEQRQKKLEAEAVARAQQAARDQIEAERRADEERRKRETEMAAAAAAAAAAATAAKKDTKGSLLSFWKRSDR